MIYLNLRYPLPLMNGKQCKVLEGFGNTICTRLDKKLSEYQSRQATDIAVSPVLKPLGQFSEPRRESPRKEFHGKDARDDLENIPIGTPCQQKLAKPCIEFIAYSQNSSVTHIRTAYLYLF